MEEILEPFPLELCTVQRGSCKNLGHLLGFAAGSLGGRDKGIKGVLTSSRGGICSSVYAVSFSVSPGTSLRLALHAVAEMPTSKPISWTSDLMST